MGASHKKTIRLSDRREITVDVSTLKQSEFAALFNPDTSQDFIYELFGRLCNEKVKSFTNILRDDYRRIIDAVITLANRPLDDPNSPSESI